MAGTQLSRRHFIAGATLAAAAIAAEPSAALSRVRASAKDVGILLVHGAWADGSSWAAVIAHLQHKGYDTTAVQLNEQSLSGDVATVREAIRASKRPLVVAGHSYGGAVVSGATSGEPNVRALVFVAAYAPDAGESVLDLNQRFPATAVGKALVFDAIGNATVDPASFPAIVMPDVSVDRARVYAAVQKPINAAALKEQAGPAGWRTIPSYFQVSSHDRVINPRLERFLADRMKAHVVLLASSHASLISHPSKIAALIERAAR